MAENMKEAINMGGGIGLRHGDVRSGPVGENHCPRYLVCLQVLAEIEYAVKEQELFLNKLKDANADSPADLPLIQFKLEDVTLNSMLSGFSQLGELLIRKIQVNTEELREIIYGEF